MALSVVQTMYSLLVRWKWMTRKGHGRMWVRFHLRTYPYIFLEGKKGKVVPVLNWLSTVPWRHMGEWRYSSTILDLGVRWRWMVSSTPRPLFPGKSPPGTHWIGGWLRPTGSLDAMGKSKKFYPAGNRTPAVQPIAYCYPDSFCLMWLRKIMTNIIRIAGLWNDTRNQDLSNNRRKYTQSMLYRLKIHIMNYGDETYRSCSDTWQ
jgi:hypothetical protein